MRLFALAGVMLIPASARGGGGAPGGPASSAVGGTTEAPVILSGGELTVTTTTLAMKFRQAALVSLVNRTTGENCIASPGPNFIDVTLLESNGEDLVPGRWVVDGTGSSANIEFSDTIRRTRLTVGVADDDVFIRLEASSTIPGVVSVSWGIYGLNLSPGRLIIPAQGGTYFDRTSTPSFQGLDYPVHWENQMVVYQGNRGCVLMYARDSVPNFKRLHASRQTGNLDMAFEMFAPGPWPASRGVASIEWRMRGFAGGWKAAADAYKTYLASVRPFVPAPAQAERAWIKQVRGVVIYLTLDYTTLDSLAREVIPGQTVILLTTWRRKPFDIDYPDYTPADDAGPFIRHAHDLGFRVMLHVNLLGVSEVNPAYSGMRPFQLKNADDLAELGWLWDEFPAGDSRRVAYISPAASQYRQLFINSIRPAVDALHPDALHLDAGGAIINDGNGLVEGLNTIQGIMQLHADILAAYPTLVLGGESTNEIIGGFNWLAQRWTSDSPPHPISTYLMGDQVYSYGFLDQPTPEEVAFTDYLKRYEGQGVAPAAFVVGAADLGADRRRTHEFLQYMRLFQSNLYAPDWSSDWGAATFRFRSADGGSAVSVEDDGTLLQMKKDGSTLYRRAHGANILETPYYIQNWPAYDTDRLYGLDPARQFWLGPTGFRPIGEMHLSSVPPNAQVGMGSMVTQEFGYFEVEHVERNWFDFVVELPGARKGTIYNLTDFKVINGAVVKISREKVGGILYNSVLLEIPPYKQAVGGTTFVEYSVEVPVAPRVQLMFGAGLVDGSAESDGVLFGVQIDGATAWRQTVLPGQGWTDGSIDLTPYAGMTIRLKLLTHPGLALNAQFDWACWKDLKVVTDFTTIETLPVELPMGASSALFSEGASLSCVVGETANVELQLPGRFVVFRQKPPPMAIGESMLSRPMDVWMTTSRALPVRFANENSGAIGPVSSAGVTRNAIAAIPPHRGATHLTATATLPTNASTLNVGFALADPPPVFGTITSYSGVDFIVRVNGSEIARQRVETTGWRDLALNIQPWAGEPVLIELIVDADENQLFDFAYWSDLTMQ